MEEESAKDNIKHFVYKLAELAGRYSLLVQFFIPIIRTMYAHDNICWG